MSDVGKLTVDIGTENMQRKLRAISKHTKALADELDKIDEQTCPECGGRLKQTKLYVGGDNEAIATERYCHDCDHLETHTDCVDSHG